MTFYTPQTVLQSYLVILFPFFRVNLFLCLQRSVFAGKNFQWYSSIPFSLKRNAEPFIIAVRLGLLQECGIFFWGTRCHLPKKDRKEKEKGERLRDWAKERIKKSKSPSLCPATMRNFSLFPKRIGKKRKKAEILREWKNEIIKKNEIWNFARMSEKKDESSSLSSGKKWNLFLRYPLSFT